MASIERLGDGSTAEAWWPGHAKSTTELPVCGVNVSKPGCYGGEQRCSCLLDSSPYEACLQIGGMCREAVRLLFE